MANSPNVAKPRLAAPSRGHTTILRTTPLLGWCSANAHTGSNSRADTRPKRANPPVNGDLHLLCITHGNCLCRHVQADFPHTSVGVTQWSTWRIDRHCHAREGLSSPFWLWYVCDLFMWVGGTGNTGQSRRTQKTHPRLNVWFKARMSTHTNVSDSLTSS